MSEQGSDDPTTEPIDDAWKSDPERWRKHRRFAVLDPAGTDVDSPGVPNVYPTVYVADELIVDAPADNQESIDYLRELANDAGWTFGDDNPLEDQLPGSDGPRDPGASTSIRIRLRVSAREGKVATTPDAWQLLRQARTDERAKGVSLNHVMTTDSIGVNPFKANPFKANPFKANPFKANPFKANAPAVGIDSYAELGFGGMQPVTYLGPAPALDPGAERRPVVAIFDTGWGRHPWFDGDVIILPYVPGPVREPIGIAPDSPTNPERYPSLAEPFDGIFDDAAGHGTFIAGIVRQYCPDAKILPVRVADGEGVIVENDLIGALGRMLDLMQKGLLHVDILNLSFSYYHETPDDPTSLSEVATLLKKIRDRGCVVVCSAGNDATDRPAYPAAMPDPVGAQTEAPVEPAPRVAVGALNPPDFSVALFSNIGEWVTVYAPGVSVVSTIPVTFNGGVQAGTRDDSHGHRRETLDADDFRHGFGVWSGTSFAAPAVAGRIAHYVAMGYDADDATDKALGDFDDGDHSHI